MSSPHPLIVKKTRKVAGDGGHHGGSWKIAYADFVTAMMAFFLLMWLTIAAGGKALNGISDYFKRPLALTLEGGKGSGDRTSPIQGGGTDLSRTEGQVRHGEVEHKRRLDDKAAANKAEEHKEVVHLQGLKVELESAVAKDAFLKQFKKQLIVDITNEGLRIQIVDEKNRPMFASGSAKLQPYGEKLLQRVGRALNMVPNRISISGHTDAKPFHGRGGYGNWDLSADRANACRRELIAGGMEPDKVLRVIGQASAVPLDAKDPFSPINRRISIIVLNNRTERDIEKMAGSVTLDSHGNLKQPAAKQPAVTPPPLPQKKVIAPPAVPLQNAPVRSEPAANPEPAPKPASRPAPTGGGARHSVPSRNESKPSDSGSSGRIPLPPISAAPSF